MQTNRNIYESEGFRAHDFLTNHSGWKVKARSRLTSDLKEETRKWKRVITTLNRPVKTRFDAPQQLSFDFSLEGTFKTLAERWVDETEHISNLNKALAHPAYQQIIGMGRAAPSLIVPLLLKELEETRDHWLVALHEITGQDPSPEDSNFDEAVEAWLNWGKERGYLTEQRA